MTRTIVVIGALDTKGNDFAFVKAAIEEAGHNALVIDVGVIGEPGLEPDIPASRVAEAAGVSLQALREKSDRGEAIAAMTKGIGIVVEELYKQRLVDGIIGMGGSAGTPSAQPFGCCQRKSLHVTVVFSKSTATVIAPHSRSPQSPQTSSSAWPNENLPDRGAES